MKIAVFGATGRTGRPFVEQALAAGHQVCALARDPGKLGLKHAQLTVMAGNALYREAVAKTVAGCDAACSMLGPAPHSPPDIVSLATGHIIEAMQQRGVRRLVVMSSMGVGTSRKQVPFSYKVACLLIPILRRTMADLERTETLVRQSGLEWTIVQAAGLRDGPATGRYVFGTDPKLRAGFVNRADVAAFLLRELAAPTFVRQAPSIT